ncbi:hypothetical protein HispidOSU_024982 [Sigmodon hispidus]
MGALREPPSRGPDGQSRAARAPRPPPPPGALAVLPAWQPCRAAGVTWPASSHGAPAPAPISAPPPRPPGLSPRNAQVTVGRRPGGSGEKWEEEKTGSGGALARCPRCPLVLRLRGV